MLGTNFPSVIENEIYDLLDDYMLGMDFYEYGAVDAITDFFMNHKKILEWMLACTVCDHDLGECAVSWIEDGHLQMTMFSYEKRA